MKKVVVIGPESTGKSTLCAALAQHFNTTWCPEYAREYLETHGMDYTFVDLLTIAKGQVAIEDRFLSAVDSQQSTVFIDTDMYVMKVWCEFAFGKCHSWILNQAAVREYDLYLLCNIDLPWIKDALREYPDPGPRVKLFHYYKDIMVNQNVPFTIISGTYDERFNTAVSAVNKLLNE